MDNVIKQGYLKKSRPTAPGSNPANSFLQLFEPTRWFVFGLRNRRPYLDYYEKEQHVFTATPINHFDLFTCTKVTYTLGRNNRNWTFCLFLQDRVLELTADSREVMLSWCRTLEHTLQSYGALKHVPSEHIYSDYPVKYKPRKSVEVSQADRQVDNQTPPPTELAPPIPGERPAASGGAAPLGSGKAETSEHSEPDTSEDDFVSEEFFKQKKLEGARFSNTLKFTSDNSLALPPRSLSSTLPSRSISFPTDSPMLDLPALPTRLHKNVPEASGMSLYSQVNKLKVESESDDTSEEADVYETAFDVPDETDASYEAAFDLRDKTLTHAESVDRNTLVAQQDIEEDMYEAAFDLKGSGSEEKNGKLVVQVPPGKSDFNDLEKLCSDKRNSSSLETDKNIYSDFNGIVSTSEVGNIGNSEKIKSEKTNKITVVDIVNNNVPVENIYHNVNTDQKQGLEEEKCISANTKSRQTEHVYGNMEEISQGNDSKTYVAITVESSKGSPVKPPRKNSRHKSKVMDADYTNVSALKLENPKKPTLVEDPEYLPMKSVGSNVAQGTQTDSAEHKVKVTQEVECVPLPTRVKPVQENIYDFGRCTEPVKPKSDNIPSTGFDINSTTSQGQLMRKDSSKMSKQSLLPSLEIRANQNRSASSSPETPRRLIHPQISHTTSNIETNNGPLELPPSPTTPTTPVNRMSIDFTPVYKSVVKVDKKRHQTPSPKGRNSRRSSHSPKTKLTEKMVNGVTDLADYSNQPIVKPRTKKKVRDGRPQSLIVMQTKSTDEMPSQPAARKESLYSPVLTKKWFDKQPMAEINAQTAKDAEKLKEMISKEPLSSNTQSKDDAIPIPFQPAKFTTLTSDSNYQVPKRVRSVPHHEPQPSFINHEIHNKNHDLRNSANGSSSPSHDGFLFNVPSRQLSAPDDDNDDEDGDTPHYEDATGRHGEPPLPPRRKKDQQSNRSQSVYVPCNINQDPNKVIVRQTSLRERQRITPEPGVVTVQPLKQSEIEILQEEQQSHGIIVKISPAACQKVALVDAFNGVWIVGWDFKHYPRLSESVHIGDEVTKINDIRVTNAHMAKKTLKSCNTEQVDLVIKRLPYAHVMAIRRRQNGENLGLQRLGGTAEITYVDPMGLSAEHGLSKQAVCVNGQGTCNWWITEINNRPLNLSFKGNEIEARLNAVGRDISIVVQPSDFIRELKKQLKKNRNFKDYMPT